ncbi:nitronate monooxygenase [Pseudooceanicola sp.]|uniref:NAD(P)H-dependent flavin oxidoreductase n=1 Tax=Pseudooceanicola sp. TaxID=1914328 RepID=UPI0026168BCF|nr:nitronate monooxygenase [Pseudooceanicola sp.]MDF1855144.1 nitronate monooxygenase [Pseudooceanicola sp.]
MHPPVFRTRLTEMFGMPHPLFVGGMMGHSRAKFVAACARSGAMAFMTPKSFASPEAFGEALAECIDLADGHPVGVNFSISRFHSNEVNDACFEIARAAGVTRFETAGNHPGEMIPRIHDAGGVVIHKSTQVRHALKAAEDGVDALIVVGMEAGGHPGINPHPGHILLSNLLPQVDIPVALGGGLGTGRQLCGALAQGADAALIATRFLTSSEIEVHDNYKTRMAEAGMDDSLAVLHSLKDTWRVLRNKTSEWVAQKEADLAGKASRDDFGEVLMGNYARENAYKAGDMDKGLMSCSAAIAHADKVQSASEIVDTLMAEARAASLAMQARTL